MLTLRKILCPVDFSDLTAAQQALLYRVRCNQAARFGRYDETLEQSS